MNINARLTLYLIPVVLLLAAVFGYLEQRRSRVELARELGRRLWAVARAAQVAMSEALRDRDLEDACEIVDAVAGFGSILGIRLFDRDGRLIHQSASLEAHPLQNPDAVAAALLGRAFVERPRLVGGEPALGVFFPLTGSSGELLGAGQVLELQSFLDVSARATRNFIATLALLLALALSLSLTLVTRYAVSRPVEHLIGAVRGVGSGDLAARVPVRGRDELARLATEFNRMAAGLEAAHLALRGAQEEHLRAEARLKDSQRLASLGHFAATLSHEIGTPLTVIQGRMRALLQELPAGGPGDRELRIVAGQIEHLAKLTGGFLHLARLKGPRLEPTRVGEVARLALEDLELRLKERGIALEADLDRRWPPIDADPGQLRQVFFNLAVNAADAMPAGGTLRVRLEQVEAAHPERGQPGRFVAVHFEDTGHGIDPEHRKRIFELFFTTKQGDRGTGVGLTVAAEMVRGHGGWIEVESEVGRGTRATVYLPFTEQAQQEPGRS